MSKRTAQIDLTKFTWLEMALVIRMLWTEMKRRNPIGINCYEGAMGGAYFAIDEIAKAEKGNPTGNRQAETQEDEMKIWQYIAVSMVFLLGLISLYASYAIISIQVHLHLLITTGMFFAAIFLSVSIFLFRIGYNLYKYTRNAMNINHQIQKASDQLDTLTVGDRILAILGALVAGTLAYAMFDMITFTLRLKADFHEMGFPFAPMDIILLFWLALATLASFVFVYEVLRGRIKAPPTPWDEA